MELYGLMVGDVYKWLGAVSGAIWVDGWGCI